MATSTPFRPLDSFVDDNKLKLELPAQPPPKITAAPAPPSPL
jgi:hypothetical protein